MVVFSIGLIASLWFTPQVTVWAPEAMDHLCPWATRSDPPSPETGFLPDPEPLFAARIPVLWPFHAVHHSAEVMTLITFLRAHPVSTALQALMVSALVGLAQALVLVALDGQIEA